MGRVTPRRGSEAVLEDSVVTVDDVLAAAMPSGALLRTPRADLERRLVTVSAAQGLAWSARTVGARCTVVMPEDAPASKVAEARLYGAEVVLAGSVIDASARMEELRAERGLVRPAVTMPVVPRGPEQERAAVAVFHAPEEGRPPGLEALEEIASVRYASTGRELADALDEAKALYVSDFRSSHLRAAWHRARRLRWVHAAGAGVDALLFPELAASDVVVTNSRGVFDRAIAEYVLGLMLAFAKGLPATLALQARHTWRHRETERLEGRRLLVIGAGPIGRAIVRLARPLGVDATVVARTARSSDPELGSVLGAGDLAASLSEADYVVVAAPLTPETEGMIGAPEFARMRPTARLINVGRGRIVDEAALLDALRAGRIAGAALDVFADEPLPTDHPFWQARGMIVSPHMSGDFVGWRSALSELFLENVRRWVDGRPLLNVVDKERGYVVNSAACG